MTSVPLQTCCERLRIDPKTLRTWLQQAQMPLYLHPSDGRMKCLTMQQVQWLAALHGRALKPSAAFLSEGAAPGAFRDAAGMPEREGELAGSQRSKESLLVPDEAAWLKQIADLQAQAASLQHQLAHLRSLAGPVTLSVPEKPTVEENEQADRKIASSDGTLAAHLHRAWAPHPGESRRARVLPLIEYGAAGRYVLICPEVWEPPIAPVPQSGLAGWPRFPPSALWAGPGGSPPRGCMIRVQNAPGMRTVPFISTITSITWGQRIA